MSKCYGCNNFEHKNNVPWCMVLDVETNAISPACAELKTENEELKKIVMAIGHYWSFALESTFQPSSDIQKKAFEAQDLAAEYYNKEQQDDE